MSAYFSIYHHRHNIKTELLSEPWAVVSMAWESLLNHLNFAYDANFIANQYPATF